MMSLLNNQLMADRVAGIYQDLEELLMRNIVCHIKDYGKPIDSDDWLLQKLAEIGKLNKENIQTIAQLADISQTAAERILETAAQESIKQLEPCLQNAAKDGLLHTAVDVDKSKNIKRTIETLQTQAKDTLNLCNTNMLYKAKDAYKKLVQNIYSKSKEIERKQDFIDIMNRSAANTVIGAESRTQAVRECIRQFNDKGIPAFVDKAGREWTPEAYVNMCMRNTARNVADEVQSERCKEYGCNLIEISSHSGARPKCAKDQGKIFDLDNGSGYTEDARGNKIRYYPWNSSSYGKPDGILGINCGHRKYPFLPGVDLQTYFPVDEEENDKLYKETQVQRALERDVRKQKRECMLYDGLGDTEAFEKSAVKLKAKEAKLKKYVDSNDNLHRRKDREQVVGFDKKVSAKTVQASKKPITKIKPKNKIENLSESKKAETMTQHFEVIDERDTQARIEFISKITGVSLDEAKDFEISVSQYGGFAYDKIRKASYMGDDYFRIDEEIFAGSTTTTPRKMAKSLEKFIEKSPKWGGNLYRGINLPQQTLSKIKVGDMIDMQGISSWTSDFNIAEAYSYKSLKKQPRNKKVIFHANGTKQGTSIKHLAHYDYEEEVLISKNAQWTVQKIEENEGTTHIYMKELEDDL